MHLTLTPEQSQIWEEGGFSSWRVEEDVIELLDRQGITEQCVVTLDDGSIAFAITPPEGRSS
jgi:hypothetical protein